MKQVSSEYASQEHQAGPISSRHAKQLPQPPRTWLHLLRILHHLLSKKQIRGTWHLSFVIGPADGLAFLLWTKLCNNERYGFNHGFQVVRNGFCPFTVFGDSTASLQTDPGGAFFGFFWLMTCKHRFIFDPMKTQMHPDLEYELASICIEDSLLRTILHKYHCWTQIFSKRVCV